jgi:hypothetical protein
LRALKNFFPLSDKNRVSSFSDIFLINVIILSTYAEDHGLCPWMNAEKVAK